MTVRTPLSDPAYYHTDGRVPLPAEPVVVAAGQQDAPGAAVDDLAAFGWHELRALAKQLGVTDYAKMKRPALEAAIRSAQEATRAGQ